MNNFMYQEEIKRTLNKDLDKNNQMLNMALGLCGESGEVADMLKKYMYQGHDLNKEELIKELGDISWYLFNMMNCLEVSSGEVFKMNIDKLRKRYEKGFSAAASVKRVDND